MQNSHSAKPLLYKISGTWGNHEGSMVLWVLILALCGGAVAGFGTNLPSALQARVLAMLALIGGRLPRLHPGDLQPLRPGLAAAGRTARG